MLKIAGLKTHLNEQPRVFTRVGPEYGKNRRSFARFCKDSIYSNSFGGKLEGIPLLTWKQITCAKTKNQTFITLAVLRRSV